MKNIYHLSLVLAFALISVQSHSQSLAWAKQFSGTASKLVNDIATDPAGNLYITGNFRGTVDFNPGSAVTNFTATDLDMFIVKLNAQGNFVWAKQIRGGSIAAGSAIAFHAGSVYITGYYRGTVDFDPGPGEFNMTSVAPLSTNWDICILKLDADGNFGWAKSIGGLGSESARKMRVDAAGNLVIACSMGSTTDFDPGPGVTEFTSAGGGDFVITKYNPSGDLLWAKHFGGSGFDEVYEMNLDATGNILAVGGFNNAVDFDPGPGNFPMTSSAGTDAFVVKLSSNGDFNWARPFRGNGSQILYGITSDASGNSYMTGRFESSIDIDPGPGVNDISSTGGNDGIILKLAADGEVIWGKVLTGNLNQEGNDIAISEEGNLYISGSFSGTTDFDLGPLTSNLTAIGQLNPFLGVYTANGDLVWVKQFSATITHMLLTPSDNVIHYGTFRDSVDFDPGPGTTTLTAVSAEADIFIAQYSKSNRITGVTFFDINGDGVRQAGEFGLPEVLIRATSNNIEYLAISDTAGRYTLLADVGTYNVSTPLPVHYQSMTPVSRTINFGNTYGQIDSANHFALFPVPNIKDLRVIVTNLMAARPGFKTIYRVTYINDGTEPMSGTLELTHASGLQFVEANPAQASYTNPTLSWSFTNLVPHQSGNIDIVFTVSPTVNMTSILKSYATVSSTGTDAILSNNSDTLFHQVTGSYDPNDKRVFPPDNITPDFVATGKYLDYTIRFQNTGTDTAFTVIVRDTLSTNLNLSSFQMLAASHKYSITIKDNGLVEWRFDNILLPDSNRNEPESHGFVRFRIKPKSTLVVGNQVRNDASIYFDFNKAVLTNGTVNTVNTITAINPVRNPIESKIFPNPALANLTIRVNGYFDYKLISAGGKVVRLAVNNYNEAILNTTALQKGIYFIEIKTKKGSAVHKIVVH